MILRAQSNSRDLRFIAHFDKEKGDGGRDKGAALRRNLDIVIHLVRHQRSCGHQNEASGDSIAECLAHED